MIELKELTTGYRQPKPKQITANFSARLERGEMVALLGPNGAGKSTLLRTLSGFQKPLSGEILIDGQEISSIGSKELSRKVSVVLTERPMLENMTVEDLVAMGRVPFTGYFGVLSDQDRAQVAEAIRMVGIENLRCRAVDSLSDGERQKVMIAKALAQETPVIFLDEPTAFLDYPSKVEMMQLLHRLAREAGKTIFMSTHDLELSLQVADRIWLIDREKGVTVGTRRELIANGSLERYFLRPGIEFDPEIGFFRIKA